MTEPEVLAIATLLGGVAALWFFWDKIASFFRRRWKKSDSPVQGPDSHWQGIELDGHYFAWRGPGLHMLQVFPPVPAPRDIHDKLRVAGLSPMYDLQRNLRENIAKGRMQVFETDKKTWRREVLLSGGDQILIVEEMKDKKV